ncbi:envelope stress response protein PspG [Dickeya solani]|uniref:Envelope stress response protein PspG n=2 Tax=Dickeya solani TaxID=1089444 RepID=A0ABU4EIV8_9GAMM|nr:envelope stress response protein PspG [Dickeya solani]ANE74742.1 phage-shock protein [Dickeya solani IPO 2222]AUC42038.1 Putative inner membrane protein [Dickeya solani RNS 08.23.3.1.A]AUH09844.1 phage shock protein G [Dickeya solani D s0432-1]AUH13801.1 phage shock protein G [Dickeya solani]AYQ49246.1 Phage shock protein G [Dickeya solani]
MLEIFFVIGFFIMLLVTGVSLLGVMAALFVAALVMLIGGLFAVAIKVLPWLLLAIVVVWMWRRFQGRPVANMHRYTYRKKDAWRHRRGNGW